jgi:hypothetical protein
MYRWTGILLTCAWILWMQSASVTSILDTYETKGACTTELERMRDRQAQQPPEKRSFTLVCLPDTVDPSQQIR